MECCGLAQLSLSAPEGSGDTGCFRQRTKSGVEPPHSTGCCLNPKRLIFTEVAVTMKLISRYRYSSLLLAALALSALMLWWGIPRAGSLAQIEIKKGSKKPAPKPETKPETKPKPASTKPSAPVRRSAPEIEMVYVTGGTFLMGSPENEPGRDSWEGPQHRVTVQSFYIGKYEVTQAQWRAVMGDNPPVSKAMICRWRTSPGMTRRSFVASCRR
jgi:formylglycine-generating enzyme required for sulfatase activity